MKIEKPKNDKKDKVDSTRSKTDYHDFTKKNTPQEIRRHLNVGDIWMNKVQCNKCKDIVVSLNRHDMQYCGCGAVFVDGGSWYGRFGGMDLNDVIDLSEPFDDVR